MWSSKQGHQTDNQEDIPDHHAATVRKPSLHHTRTIPPPHRNQAQNTKKRAPLGRGANLPWFSRCVRAWLRPLTAEEPSVATQHPGGRAGKAIAASHRWANSLPKKASPKPLNCYASTLRGQGCHATLHPCPSCCRSPPEHCPGPRGRCDRPECCARRQGSEPPRQPSAGS